ncbi:MAG: RidA family protein [Opitutales bacterium]|nr:RidA family protein [Opitutales bacterium]
MKQLFSVTIVLSLLVFFSACSRELGPEERLHALGIELPEVSPAIANYVGAVRSGNLVFLAGHLPRDADGEVITGKLGADMDVDEGYEAARQATIALLATLKAEIGSLDEVVRVVKVFGMVNAAPDFSQHSQVINGASDLLGEVFGDRGRHARAAAGFSSLPLNAAVEVEMIVEVE